jgi:hypothetical protein
MLKQNQPNPNLSNQLFFSICCIGLTLGYCYILLMAGMINMPANYLLSSVFFDMWNHLHHLDLALDPRAIGDEGFRMGDKVTAYFLPLPALVRGFLSIFQQGDSALVSMLMAVFFFVVASVAIWRILFSLLREIRPHLSPHTFQLGIIFFSFCTPIMTTLVFPGVFWEAISWGAASFISAAALSILLLQGNARSFPTAQYLAFAFACGVALFTRATFSFASCWLFLLTTIFLLYQRHISTNPVKDTLIQNKQAVWGVLLFICLLACLLFFNYSKWGNPFEFYPIDKYIMWGPNEQEIFNKIGALSISRIPENFAFFFIPSADNFLATKPFIQFGVHHYFSGLGAFNYTEPTLPLTLTIPVTILLFFIGLGFFFFNIRRHKKIILIFFPSAICSLIPVIFILSHHAQSLRYAGDFMPALVIFSQIGIANLIIIFSKSSPAFATASPTSKVLTRTLFYFFIFLLFTLSSLGPILQNKLWSSPRYTGAPYGYLLAFNQIIKTQKNADLNVMQTGLGNGWHSLEDWGVWSNGNESSSLLITPPLGSTSKNLLTLTVNALITPAYPLQVIDVRVNGQLVQSVSISDNADHEIQIPLPKTAIGADIFMGFFENIYSSVGRALGISLINLNAIKLELTTQFPNSPRKLGISPEDQREIGFGLKSIEIRN